MAAPLPEQVDAPDAVGAVREPPLQKRWLLALAAVALGAVTLFLGLNAREWWQRLLGRSNREPIQSLAVLLLENLSGDPAQEYFADGMTDELTTDLAKLRSVRVISRGSAMHYKGTRKTLPEIARELKVDCVVEGSVARAGNKVRVRAQLIRAATDQHLWAETYERDLSDILAVESDIARDVAREIKITLTAEQQADLRTARRVNPEAYEAYLRGLFYLGKGFEEDLEKNTTAAIELLEHAITLDPNFALAQAALAKACLYKNSRFGHSKELQEKASHSIEKALSINPNLAEAYVARSWLEGARSDHRVDEGAIKDLHRALAINPNLSDAHFQLGGTYLEIGLLDKADRELNAALALDPENPEARYYVPRLHLYQQKYELALSELERTEFSPNWQRALALWYLGRRKEALAFVEGLRKDFPGHEDVASTYAVLLGAGGEREKAEEQIRIAIAAGQGKRHFHHAEYNIASAYALMGKNRLAVEWLEKTVDDGLPCYPLFEKDLNLNNLRGDPLFVAFLEKMRLQWGRWKNTFQ